jgi:hypothetical protein
MQVNGPATKSYFTAYHPEMVVHLMAGWRHGSFWLPSNLDAVMAMLRPFLLTEA